MDNVELLKRLYPGEYFEQYLAEGVYPDGRDVAQFRPTSIECGGATGGNQGSAFVRQGGASVSCTVQLSMAPDSDDPLVQWEIESMEGVQKDLLDHSQAHLNKIFAGNYLLDPEDLKFVVQRATQQQPTKENQNVRPTAATVSKGFELQWTLHLKITVLSSDGFLLDSILVAVQAALSDIRLPTHVEYSAIGDRDDGIFAEDDDFLLGEEVPMQFDIEKVRILDPETEKMPLKLKQLLVYVPFLLYRSKECKEEDERILLCDPSSELCNFVKDRCEVIIGPNGSLHSLAFNVSSGSLDPAFLNEIMVFSRRRHTAISKSLQKCTNMR